MEQYLENIVVLDWQQEICDVNIIINYANYLNVSIKVFVR